MNKEEEQELRLWLRQNYDYYTQPNKAWEPILIKEWIKITEEKGFLMPISVASLKAGTIYDEYKDELFKNPNIV